MDDLKTNWATTLSKIVSRKKQKSNLSKMLSLTFYEPVDTHTKDRALLDQFENSEYLTASNQLANFESRLNQLTHQVPTFNFNKLIVGLQQDNISNSVKMRNLYQS